METKNNFISVIALGNFNPAILTPAFLDEKCGFKNSVAPKGQTSPVVSSIEFGNISFVLELEKFQIMEKNISDFAETRIVNLLTKYLEILTYTPVFVIGLNLNLSIKTNSEGLIKAITALNDRKHLLELLHSKDLTYSSKIKYSAESTDYLVWDIISMEDVITRITVNLKNDTFTVNYNKEIRDIDKDRGKISFFDRKLNDINGEFQYFLKSLFL